MSDIHLTSALSRSRPMEERLVRLPISSIIKVLNMVQTGVFASFDEAMEAAIEALVDERNPVLESAAPSEALTRPPNQVWAAPMGFGTSVQSPGIGLMATDVEIATVSPTQVSLIPSKILLFTVPRLLPVKLVLSALSSELNRQAAPWIGLDAFYRTVGPIALQWRETLDRMDRSAHRSRGGRLATAFPNESRDLRRSLDRFLATYVGYVYEDGRIGGAPAFLGLAAVRGTSEAAEVGMTAAGLEFLRLNNPVLHEGSNSFPPLSRLEVDLLLRQFVASGSSEEKHLAWYLRALRDNPRSDRNAVNRMMKRFYEHIWNPLELTQEMVDSTRAGIHSRSVEMGLARTIRKGKEANYVVTEEGANWLSRSERRKDATTEALE